MLFDANEMQPIKVISAHQTALSCIAMNSEGTLLATASEKGTIIRVFELPSARKLYQFRRGSMPARIYCMSFNDTSTLLCVSSATETVHIFKLTPQNGSNTTDPDNDGGRRDSDGEVRNEISDPTASTDLNLSMAGDSSTSITTPTRVPSSGTTTAGFMSLMRRTSQNVSSGLVSRAAGYLPSSVTEIWEPSRDFAWLKIPRSKTGQQVVKSVVALSSNAPQVLVATSEGEYLVYNIDLDKGGEGVLIKQHS